MPHGWGRIAGQVRASRNLIEPWYLSYLLLGVAIYGLAAILIPLIVTTTGHRPLWIGAVIALQNVGLLTGDLWGLIMDRTGRHRLVLLSGSLLIALGFAGFALFRSLVALLASSCLTGIGTAAAASAAILFIVGLKPESEWSDRIGYLQLFNSVGTMIGFALAGLLTVHSGAIAAAACALFSAVLAGLMLPASATPDSNSDISSRNPNTVPATSQDASSVTLAEIHELWPFRLLLICWFLLTLGTVCFTCSYPIIMQHVFGAGVGLSSGIVSCAAFVGLPLYAATGMIIHRLGSSLVLAGGIACRAACLLGLGCLSLYEPTNHHVLSFTLVGAFEACWPITSVSASDEMFRISSLGRGLSSGAFTSAGALASIAGALLAGMIADAAGFRFISAASAFFVVLALILALAMHLGQQRLLRKSRHLREKPAN